MTFEEVYKKYKYIIHYLLKKYNIQYNYDEYAQLLLIKMWELSKIYNSQKRISLNTFLYSRLIFYLIDLFRKHQALTLVDISEQEVKSSLINDDYELAGKIIGLINQSGFQHYAKTLPQIKGEEI